MRKAHISIVQSGFCKVEIHILCILFILSADLHCNCDTVKNCIQQFELCCAYDSMMVSECVIMLLWMCVDSCLKCLWVLLLWLLDSLVYFIYQNAPSISVWFYIHANNYWWHFCALKSFDLYCVFFRVSVPIVNVTFGVLTWFDDCSGSFLAWCSLYVDLYIFF